MSQRWRSQKQPVPTPRGPRDWEATLSPSWPWLEQHTGHTGQLERKQPAPPDISIHVQSLGCAPSAHQHGSNQAGHGAESPDECYCCCYYP